MSNTSNQNLLFQGNKLAVLGAPVKVGQKVPTFKLTGNDMKDLDYSRFAGKTLIISVVPSLDTPTCSLQTKRFNQEAAKLPNVAILTVSADLPFAQKRWCGAEGVTNLTTASDYKYRGFGEAFGCYLQDMGLLARSVFVVDKSGTVSYVDYVVNLSDEPEYAPVLAAAAK